MEKPESSFLHTNLGKRRKKLITKVKNQRGEIRTSQEEIEEQFSNFWSEIYSPSQIPINCQWEKQIEDAELPKIRQESKAVLNRKFTRSELDCYMKSVRDSTPGPDGFSAKWYNIFWDFLGPICVDAFNTCVQDNKLPDYMTFSAICLLPKEEAKRDDPAAYKPISLQPTIYKIFAGTLAARINPHMERLVHKMQKAYVKGRNMAQSQLNMMTKIQEAIKEGKIAMMLCLDFKKAFDKMRHRYIEKVLQERDLREFFVTAAMLTV